MTNVEQAKMNRNAGTCTFLTTNASDYATDLAFEAIKTKMLADTASVEASAVAVAEDIKGYSADKKMAKILVCQQASTLCASARVKLLMLNNYTLADTLHAEETYFSKAPDAEATARLQIAHDVLETNVILITADYITPADITDFQANITSYSTLSGSSININKTSPVLTKKFKADLKTTSQDIVTIRLLIKKYKATKPAFYNGLVASCKIPTVSVRHTTVIFAVTNSTTGDNMQNVAGTLSKTTEKPLSNASGIITYTTVSAGKSTATFTQQGFKTQTVEVVIKSGEINNFTVQLVPDVVMLTATN